MSSDDSESFFDSVFGDGGPFEAIFGKGGKLDEAFKKAGGKPKSSGTFVRPRSSRSAPATRKRS